MSELDQQNTLVDILATHAEMKTLASSIADFMGSDENIDSAYARRFKEYLGSAEFCQAKRDYDLDAANDRKDVNGILRMIRLRRGSGGSGGRSSNGGI